MAFTIENTPKPVDFAKNQIGFKVERTRSRMFRFYFIFGSPLVIGTYIEFAWSDKLLHYDVVESADNSGTQITATNDVSIIHADLIKNSIFNNAWDLAQESGTHLGYYERDELSFYSIEIITNATNFSVTYADKIYEDPQRLVSELFIKNQGDQNFASQGYSFHPIDNSGISLINITDKLLRGFKPYTPAVGNATITEIVNELYYLKIWEYLPGEGNMFQELLTTDTFIALNGKLPIKDFITFTWPVPFYLLTNAPDWRETWLDAHQELTLLVTADIASFDLSVKLYFDDETDATEAISTTSCAQWKSYFIPSGVTQLDIAGKTPEGKTCYRYEVVITSNASTVSKSFIINDRPEFGRIIRFMNSKGGYDIIPLYAYISAKKSVDSTVAERSINIFNQESETVLNDISNPVESYEMETSALTRSEVEHLKELLDSPFVYLEENGEFKRIVLTTQDLDLWNDKESLFNPKLAFRYA